MTTQAKPLAPTQQAALKRLQQEKIVNWSATTATEARAFNALIEKGLAKKSGSRYELTN